MGLPKSWVSGIFRKFQARYTHKWVSAMDGIEEIAVDEWAIGLAGLTSEQIADGLARWQEPWPPSLPEFRHACINKKPKINEYGLGYVPECYRKRETRRDRLLSSDDREEKRNTITQGIEGMRAALRCKTN
jgi:hypothetical protein